MLFLVELSSEEEDEADDDLNSEYTESVDEEESKLRVQSLTSTKVRTQLTAASLCLVVNHSAMILTVCVNRVQESLCHRTSYLKARG